MLANSARTVVKAIATALLMTLGAVPLHAQDDAKSDMADQLLACDSVSDAAEKMACFDAVVKGLKQNTDMPAAELPPEPNTAPDVPATVAGAAATPSATPTPTQDKIPGPLATDAATVATTPVVTDTADSVAVSQDAAIDDFGLEDRVAARKKEEVEFKSINASIVEAWSTVDHRFEVLLDNGQVWRETELTRSNRLPREGSPVRITKGRLGSYRMKIGNDNRLAAVRRTK